MCAERKKAHTLAAYEYTLQQMQCGYSKTGWALWCTIMVFYRPFLMRSFPPKSTHAQAVVDC